MSFVDLKDITPPPRKTIEAVSLALIKKLKILPLDSDNGSIFVATSEPTDTSIADTLRFQTKKNIKLVLSTHEQIEEWIKKLSKQEGESPETTSQAKLLSLIDEFKIFYDEEDVDPKEEEVSETDTGVIRLVHSILTEAFQKKSSDIHVEPGIGKEPLRIRYRIDGVCRIAHEMPARYKNAFIARLKIMSKLDIAEHRKPQSGKLTINISRQPIEYRVEVTPTIENNEHVVLRILSSSKPLPLEALGFTSDNIKKFESIINKPYGLILVCGPTGSGKTTTLHSAIKYLNNDRLKIWTAEDPVEITQKGLCQVQVNPRIGYTFQDALRSFLRADPDVIMIGEMRDSETSKTAIAASLTGHLVLSTLHTNGAPEAAARLLEMGMDPFNFSDALIAILSQRLIRKLCSHCKIQINATPKDRQEIVHQYGRNWLETDNIDIQIDPLQLFKPNGCSQCYMQGVIGRIGLHELMIASDTIKQTIKSNADTNQMKQLALNEGMRTLKMDAIQKVLQGIIDLSQIKYVSS